MVHVPFSRLCYEARALSSLMSVVLKHHMLLAPVRLSLRRGLMPKPIKRYILTKQSQTTIQTLGCVHPAPARQNMLLSELAPLHCAYSPHGHQSTQGDSLSTTFPLENQK